MTASARFTYDMGFLMRYSEPHQSVRTSSDDYLRLGVTRVDRDTCVKKACTYDVSALDEMCNSPGEALAFRQCVWVRRHPPCAKGIA